MLDWVVFIPWSKATTEIHCCHCVKILVLAGVAGKLTELGVEKILAMTAVLHAIVNQGLENDFHSSFCIESNIFTVARHNLSKSVKTIFDSCTINTFMLN